MQCRAATPGDHELLVAWNRALQIDEGAAPMEPPELLARLQRWLGTGYDAMIFEIDSSPAGYALFRPTDPDSEGLGGIYLRQFYIAPSYRRAGHGSRAFRLFVDETVRGRRLLLDALETNPAGQGFWSSLGLRIYSRRFELTPSAAALVEGR